MFAAIKNDIVKNPIHIAVHAALWVGVIFMVFPFIWMVGTSFKSPEEIVGAGRRIVVMPDVWRPDALNTPEDRARIASHAARMAKYEVARSELVAKIEAAKADASASADLAKQLRDLDSKKPFTAWANYKKAWNAQPFYRYFLNTLFVSITLTALSLILSAMAAYAFAFFKFTGKNLLFYGLLGTMMIPQQALLIPNYVMLSELRWVNTFAALIVPWLVSVYSIFFLRQFFLQLPKDLFEAAKIDGCSRLGFFFRILLPLSKPPMVTLGIFSFLTNWNSFVWPLIVTNDQRLRVIQVGLSYFSSESGTDWGAQMAAATFTILPLVIGYFIAQKQFVESTAMTGMKE